MRLGTSAVGLPGQAGHIDEDRATQEVAATLFTARRERWWVRPARPPDPEDGAEAGSHCGALPCRPANDQRRKAQRGDPARSLAPARPSANPLLSAKPLLSTKPLLPTKPPLSAKPLLDHPRGQNQIDEAGRGRGPHGSARPGVRGEGWQPTPLSRPLVWPTRDDALAAAPMPPSLEGDLSQLAAQGSQNAGSLTDTVG